MSELQVSQGSIPVTVSFRCNFHKRCYNAPRNNCVVSPSGLSTLAPAPMTQGGIAVGQPGSSTIPTSSGLPHTLAEHNYKNFTLCKVCNNLLVGIVRQGLKCRDCGVSEGTYRINSCFRLMSIRNVPRNWHKTVLLPTMPYPE